MNGFYNIHDNNNQFFFVNYVIIIPVVVVVLFKFFLLNFKTKEVRQIYIYVSIIYVEEKTF